MEAENQEKCAGCAVRHPHEHRCHGFECTCSNPSCIKSQGRITHLEMMEIVNMGLKNARLMEENKALTQWNRTIEWQPMIGERCLVHDEEYGTTSVQEWIEHYEEPYPGGGQILTGEGWEESEIETSLWLPIPKIESLEHQNKG